VVDDEPVIVRLMERALLSVGYAVHGATSAVEAMRYLDLLPAPPSLIVTDLGMAPVNGASLAKLALARWPGTPVLFISAFRTPEYGSLPGPLLLKPFYPRRLIEVVAPMISPGLEPRP